MRLQHANTMADRETCDFGPLRARCSPSRCNLEIDTLISPLSLLQKLMNSRGPDGDSKSDMADALNPTEIMYTHLEIVKQQLIPQILCQ